MQTKPLQLLYQQIVLKHLGYYRGRLDGVWSAKCISAKKEFENHVDFVPGLPTRGLPFVVEYMHPLPKGIRAIAGEVQGLITHATLSDEDLAKYLEQSKLKSEEIEEKVAVQAKEKADAKKASVVLNEEPKVIPRVAEGPLVSDQASKSATVVESAVTAIEEHAESSNAVETKQNNQNHHKHQSKKHKKIR